MRFIKVLFLSILLVAFLQINHKGQTLERHILSYLRSQEVVQAVNDVAIGAYIFSMNSWHWVNAKLNQIQNPGSSSEAKR